MLCRENPDGTKSYRRHVRVQVVHSNQPAVPHLPEILLPESEGGVSGDQQASDGVVASSAPADPPPLLPADPPPPALRRRVRRVRRVGGHVWSPPSSEDSLEDFGESDSEEVEYFTETETLTGEVRRFTHDNNGRRIPYP